MKLETIKTTLTTLAQKATDASKTLESLESMVAELRESLKAERLQAAASWATKVPTFEACYRVQNQRQVIGKGDNVRFSKGVPDVQTMAALNAAAKDPDCVLVLQTKAGYRKVKAADLEESHARYSDLLPDMSEADRTAFESAKVRYNLLVTGTNLVPEAQQEVTFLD